MRNTVIDMGTGRISIPDTPALDPRFLELKEDEAGFFKTLTGVHDDEALERHIIHVQSKAFEVFKYPCIRGFAFTKLKISRLPTYPNVLRLHKERPGAILLDVGCCFGNDLRKAVFDGWPVKNVIGLDLEPAFWEYGHELFKSTPETFPAAFVAGDIFDPKILELHGPFRTSPTSPRPQSLQGLKVLSPLRGHISAIHASSLFHLFGVEEHQLLLARLLAGLLSPESGSTIFGSHVGTGVKGSREDIYGCQVFCHSPESWRELWDGQVFEKGMVHVDAVLVAANRKDISKSEQEFLLVWSVTRL